MAYSNSTSDRMDELRFRSQQTARNDSPLLALVSPPRNGARLPPPTHSQDGRANLTRRFTTDSGRVPTLNSIASPSQRVQDGGQEYPPSVSRIVFSSSLHGNHLARLFRVYLLVHSPLLLMTFNKPHTIASIADNPIVDLS
jgi:hypothetical protein